MIYDKLKGPVPLWDRNCQTLSHISQRSVQVTRTKTCLSIFSKSCLSQIKKPSKKTPFFIVFYKDWSHRHQIFCGFLCITPFFDTRNTASALFLASFNRKVVLYMKNRQKLAKNVIQDKVISNTAKLTRKLAKIHF